MSKSEKGYKKFPFFKILFIALLLITIISGILASIDNVPQETSKFTFQEFLNNISTYQINGKLPIITANLTTILNSADVVWEGGEKNTTLSVMHITSYAISETLKQDSQLYIVKKLTESPEIDVSHETVVYGKTALDLYRFVNQTNTTDRAYSYFWGKENFVFILHADQKSSVEPHVIYQHIIDMFEV